MDLSNVQFYAIGAILTFLSVMISFRKSGAKDLVTAIVIAACSWIGFILYTFALVWVAWREHLYQPQVNINEFLITNVIKHTGSRFKHKENNAIIDLEIDECKWAVRYLKPADDYLVWVDVKHINENKIMVENSYVIWSFKSGYRTIKIDD